MLILLNEFTGGLLLSEQPYVKIRNMKEVIIEHMFMALGP